MKPTSDKDLFGKKKKTRRSRLEILLNSYDKSTFDRRLSRVKYIQRIQPRGTAFGPMDMIYLTVEAKTCYINGQFIATILLAQAFIERILQQHMESYNIPGSSRGLKFIVSYYRRHSMINEVILNKIDKLRLIRNPYTHQKEFDHPFNLDRRSLLYNKHPHVVLQEDAESALSLMYTIGTMTLS